jgi:ATP-dependent helicase/nuclease subunit B
MTAAEALPLSEEPIRLRQELWQQVMAAQQRPLPPAQAAHGITVLQTEDEEEEAALIALIAREGLTSPHKTTAIVTPDTRRMERIRLQLALWDIQVTTPQGVPLAALPFGRLICKLAQCLAQEVSVTSLLDVLHDPAVTLDPSLLAALRDACRGVLSALPLSQRIARLAVSSPACSELAVTIARMEQLSITSLPLSRWLEALAELQAALAPEISDGREAVRELLAAMSQHASADRLSPVDALEILALALQEPVRRPHPHAHPRVHILSPVEARLQRFDRVILAGFNEGEWTAPPTPDPWLNLAQKAALGLPPPGADTSLLALDVALLGMAPELLSIALLPSAYSTTVVSPSKSPSASGWAEGAFAAALLPNWTARH